MGGPHVSGDRPRVSWRHLGPCRPQPQEVRDTGGPETGFQLLGHCWALLLGYPQVWPWLEKPGSSSEKKSQRLALKSSHCLGLCPRKPTGASALHNNKIGKEAPVAEVQFYLSRMRAGSDAVPGEGMVPSEGTRPVATNHFCTCCSTRSSLVAKAARALWDGEAPPGRVSTAPAACWVSIQSLGASSSVNHELVQPQLLFCSSKWTVVTNYIKGLISKCQEQE